MVKQPKLVVVYIYPLNGNEGFSSKALEFAQSYQRNPPGMAHDTVIVCNGAPATEPSKALFDALPNRTYLNHDNSGWDIGGFQLAAKTVDADMMVFFGASTYFRKPNWLARMYEVFGELGDTLYGSTGNQGDTRFNVYPHVRTTAFWCRPQLLRDYPHNVTQGGGGGQRYEAEHGPTCLTNWVKKQAKEAWIVGWDDIAPVLSCDSIANGFHKNDQSGLLVGDRLCAPPYWPTP